MISEQNKGSYFFFKVDLNHIGMLGDEVKHTIETELDLILAGIKAGNNVYRFNSVEDDLTVYIFNTVMRKRKGQLDKLIERHLLEKGFITEYDSRILSKGEFKQTLESLKNQESLRLVVEPLKFGEYTGKDLKIFDKIENWYDWQKDIYNKIFDKSGRAREGDHRKIITLYDKTGCSGKSSFFKYLFFNHYDKIGRISMGTSSQLRASLLQIGAKDIYIIDIVRSGAENSQIPHLIGCLEDLKSGLVLSSMYGAGANLLLEPPTIIVSSNFIFDENLLSKDRWDMYEIKNGKLKNITRSLKTKKIVKKQ